MLSEEEDHVKAWLKCRFSYEWTARSYAVIRAEAYSMFNMLSESVRDIRPRLAGQTDATEAEHCAFGR